MMAPTLSGRLALVTGASRGIGRAVAVALAKAGADVTVNYRSHEEEALEVCREIGRMGVDLWRFSLIPVGRFGEVEEVADVVVLLAGNGYITGQTFNVNGGWYMS